MRSVPVIVALLAAACGNATSPPLASDCLVFTPATLAFGTVEPGTQVTAAVEIANRCPFAVSLVSAGNALGSNSPFVAGFAGERLAVGGRLDFPITFDPAVTGTASDSIVIVADRSYRVPVQGTGGDPLVCTPLTLAFPPALPGAAQSQKVSCSNLGGPGSPDLTLTAVSDDPHFAAVCPDAGCFAGTGQTLDLEVTFHPDVVPGGSAGTLTVASDVAAVGPVAVALSGNSIGDACVFSIPFVGVLPSPLRAGTRASLGFSLQNAGTAPCLARVSLTVLSQGQAVSQIAQVRALGTAVQDETITFPVPDLPGDYTYLLEVPSPGGPSEGAQQTGNFKVVASCLTASTTSVDFRNLPCTGTNGGIYLFDVCGQPLALQQAAITTVAGTSGEGQPSPDFSLQVAPLPLQVPFGNVGTLITLDFVNPNAGTYQAVLTLVDSLDPTPLVIPLQGTRQDNTTTETFTVDGAISSPEVFTLMGQPPAGGSSLVVAINGQALAASGPSGVLWRYDVTANSIAVAAAVLVDGDQVSAIYPIGCQ